MLIARAPFRISFFGGGTDYYEYYSEHGGSVISTTIDKYCYVTLRDVAPFLPFKNQLTYSKIERFDTPDELSHPLVRAALRRIPYDGIQISYDADMPAYSGIGSSSAFAVALVQGLHAMRGEYPDKLEIAKEAIYLEREMCKEAGGVQDQIASAFGGFNRYYFGSDGFSAEPVDISPKRLNALQSRLMLMFTGFTHFSGEVARAQQENIAEITPYLHEIKKITDEAQKVFEGGNTDDIGALLDESWALKKRFSSKVTTDEIDSIYEKAKQNGALGGKILGAGGGGFMLLFVPPEKQEGLLKAMSDFSFVSFRFENEGAKLMYGNSEEK